MSPQIYILILRLVGQWRCLGIDSCAKLLVEHIETIAVVLDHAKVVDDVLGVLFFLHLLIYKPLEHALCGIVILLGSESEEVVDEGGNLLLCLLYTSPSPRDLVVSRMPSSA